MSPITMRLNRLRVCATGFRLALSWQTRDGVEQTHDVLREVAVRGMRLVGLGACELGTG